MQSNVIQILCFDVVNVDREAAREPRSWPVLLHQPGMSDGRQHGRQRGDASRRGLISLRYFALYVSKQVCK